MNTEMSRREFCRGTMALAAISAPNTISPHTVIAAPAPDDRHLIELCRAHIAMNPVIDAIWERHVALYQAAIDEIGECDVSSHEGNRRWWDSYLRTDAGRTEDEHQEEADEQGRLMEVIVRIPAHTLLGIAAKLDLWRRTDADYLGGNDVLWESLATDIEDLTGFRIAQAVAS
jgi:hypothetical protein